MSVILSPQWGHLSEATSPKWDYCSQTGGSEAPSCTLASHCCLLLVFEVQGRGFGTGSISSSTTATAVLALPGVLKLFFLEAEPGALGLTSPILRHGKRVF